MGARKVYWNMSSWPSAMTLISYRIVVATQIVSKLDAYVVNPVEPQRSMSAAITPISAGAQ
jgi:hypothetical protein